jgi:hypothetical protein
MNDLFTGSYFAQKILLGLGVVFALYWTVSIFVFLFKRSLYTSYTVVIQRYWKRALYLFWALELFLFSIYIYLILVAPTEVEWLLDQPQLFSSTWWDGNLFFTKITPLLLIIVIALIIQYVLVNGNLFALYSLCLGLSILLLSVVFSDTAQTYMYSVYFSGTSWEFEVDSNQWLFNAGMDKTRTITQYMFLITILKFWHTVFIASFWLVSLMFVLQSPYVGQGLFAANKQNFFFLYGFGFIWICLLYKSFSNYKFESVYQWFFVNTWGIEGVTLSEIFEPLNCLL